MLCSKAAVSHYRGPHWSSSLVFTALAGLDQLARTQAQH